MSVLENMKKLQESWLPATTILRLYVVLWTLHVQSGKFLYYSIVDTYYKGGTGAYALVYTLVVHA